MTPVEGTGAVSALPVAGQGPGGRARSPFAAAALGILPALGFGVATLVWIAAGHSLPGGRWLAVHLFTLGVVTNMVLTFSEHFARTVTRTPGERSVWWPLATNAGILLTLVGLPTGQRAVFAAGATIVTVTVSAAYLRIRRMRRAAIGARFGWVARVYERAHGAFLHGAVLGLVLGVGVLPGSWHFGVRTAHLHANVLGWGGLTLLATLVFFGPTMARTRIEPGADARAARALRHGATGLGAAVVLLVLTGAPAAAGTAARLAAAGSLAVLAWAATAVCVPVARAALAAKPTAARPLVVAVAVWLPAVVWIDVVVVALGAWRWLDTVGVAALAAVLGQSMLATLIYLAPMLLGRTTGAREVIRLRLEVGTRSRAVLFQVGALLCVGGAARLAELPLAGAGWALIAATLAATAIAALWPADRSA